MEKCDWESPLLPSSTHTVGVIYSLRNGMEKTRTMNQISRDRIKFDDKITNPKPFAKNCNPTPLKVA